MTPYIYFKSQKSLLRTLYLGGGARHTCVTPTSHPAPLGVTRLPFPAPCLPYCVTPKPFRCDTHPDTVTPYMYRFEEVIWLKNLYLAGQFSASHRHTKKIGFCYFLHFNLSPMSHAPRPALRSRRFAKKGTRPLKRMLKTRVLMRFGVANRAPIGRHYLSFIRP